MSLTILLSILFLSFLPVLVIGSPIELLLPFFRQHFKRDVGGLIIPGLDQNTYYQLTGTNDTEANARITCENLGGTLADIFGDAEHAYLAEWLYNNSITGPVYYNSWNGDDYGGACIGLWPGATGGATTQIPCDGQQGLCKFSSTATTSNLIIQTTTASAPNIQANGNGENVQIITTISPPCMDYSSDVNINKGTKNFSKPTEKTSFLQHSKSHPTRSQISLITPTNSVTSFQGASTQSIGAQGIGSAVVISKSVFTETGSNTNVVLPTFSDKGNHHTDQHSSHGHYTKSKETPIITTICKVYTLYPKPTNDGSWDTNTDGTPNNWIDTNGILIDTNYIQITGINGENGTNGTHRWIGHHSSNETVGGSGIDIDGNATFGHNATFGTNWTARGNGSDRGDHFHHSNLTNVHGTSDNSSSLNGTLEIISIFAGMNTSYEFLVISLGSEYQARTFCLQIGAALADIYGSDEQAYVAQRIPATCYFNSWNGDDYGTSCIAIYPGPNDGTTSVPPELCAGPLNSICKKFL